MKCPSCGRTIEDGSLFCKYCFADLNLVPEYEPVMEDRLTLNMERMMKSLNRKELQEQRKLRRLKQLKLIWFGIGAFGLLFVCMLFLRILTPKPEPVITEPIPEAEAAEQVQEPANPSGEEAEAEVQPVTTVASLNPFGTVKNEEDSADDTPEVILARADGFLQAGEWDKAKAEAARILQVSTAQDEEVMSAYRILVKTYVQRQDYEGLNRMLTACGNEAVQQQYLEYMVFDPEVSVTAGTYEAPLEVQIHTPGNGAVFYTLDGTDPTTASLLYKDSIVLLEGSYELTCVYVNHFDLASAPKRVQLKIVKDLSEEDLVEENFAEESYAQEEAESAASGE